MALISISKAMSLTPAYAARPRIRGHCITWCACLCPSFRRYQVILLGSRGT